MHELGHEVASLGGYIDPAHPHDDVRPALNVPMVRVVKDAVDALGQQGHTDTLQAAKEHIPDAILGWADTIVQHHYLHTLYSQWPRIRDWLAGDSNRRVIWRTVGQSVDGNEHDAAPFRAEGLEIVRYSPRERAIPLYAGEDALIRFYKDPAEWHGWQGDIAAVGNVTQRLKQRDPWTHYEFWRETTEALAAYPAGPGSEEIQGWGSLPYPRMQEYLRQMRAYLYLGTQPASYTLGLIEAMMTGTPIVSIGPAGFRFPIFPYVPEMFEGHELAPFCADTPAAARTLLIALLSDPDYAAVISAGQRKKAIELFGIDTIREQWRAFLS